MAVAQKIDISSSTIFRTILILVGFWFLYIIRDIIVILVAAIVIASAIEPVANRLQRYRIPRALSVILVYLLFLGIIGLAFTLILPSLTSQVAQLSQTLPQVKGTIETWVGTIPFLPHEEALDQLQGSLTQVSSGLSTVSLNIFQQTRTVFSGVVSVFFVFVIALYLVVEENALNKLARIVVPAEHYRYVVHAIDRMQAQIGRWVMGQLSLGIIVCVIVTIGLWLLGVKTPLAFGILSGVLEIIPVLGPVVAAIPGVIVGFSQSTLLGLGLILFYVAVQQIENNVLVPNVMRKVTGLNPIATLIAVLLAARLFGVVGVMLAVPVATMVGVFASDFFSDTTKR